MQPFLYLNVNPAESILDLSSAALPRSAAECADQLYRGSAPWGRPSVQHGTQGALLPPARGPAGGRGSLAARPRPLLSGTEAQGAQAQVRKHGE